MSVSAGRCRMHRVTLARSSVGGVVRGVNKVAAVRHSAPDYGQPSPLTSLSVLPICVRSPLAFRGGVDHGIRRHSEACRVPSASPRTGVLNKQRQSHRFGTSPEQTESKRGRPSRRRFSLSDSDRIGFLFLRRENLVGILDVASNATKA